MDRIAPFALAWSGLLGALLVAVPARATPDPTLDELRTRFLQGDLWAVAQGRAIHAARGEDVTVGPLGLLDDLARFVRCLPLGPVPEAESRPFAAARALIRLERIHLEQLSRDGEHAGTPLADLLPDPPLYRTTPEHPGPAVVRWPIEDETWPGEVVESPMTKGRCPSRPGAEKEPVAKVHEARARLRSQAASLALARLIGELDALPPAAAGGVALAYVRQASASLGFAIPLEWSRPLEAALIGAAPRVKTAGLLALARIHEGSKELDQARAIYRGLEASKETTDAEDSRVRARLAVLEEPDFARVLEVVRGVRATRPEDAASLAYAEARALYGLHRIEALQSFGRRWLATPRGPGELEDATRDLLIRLGVELDPASALTWLAEIGDPSGLRGRLDQLGQLALETNHLELATVIYDRLRLEAASERAQRGAPAVAELARWLAARARVEFAREDVEGFAGFIGELLDLARAESDRPLARFAPHREVLRLTQDLLGRLTNGVAAAPELRSFATVLLDAGEALTQGPSRFLRALEEQKPPLLQLAGPAGHSRGRSLTAPSPGARPSPAKRARSVKHLGEVVIPRLPPRLEAKDVPTPFPDAEPLLVYEIPGGEHVAGIPWASLAEARRAQAKSAAQPAP